MAKLSMKGLMGIAVVLSLLVALLAWNYLENYTKTANKGDATVVVAKVDILPNTLITADMVEQVKIPSAYLQPNAIIDINYVVGIYAKENIKAKEQITERLIMGDTKTAGFTGLIPGGRRAMSVPVNDVTGVAGFIKPGDFVDVIVTADQRDSGPVSSMTFQNILVLASDRKVNRGEAGGEVKGEVKAATITIAVTPDEATMLALASAKGTVSFALRPFSTSPVAGNNVPVTSKTLSSLTGYVPSPAAKAEPIVYANYAPSERSPVRPKTVSVIKGTKEQEINVQ